MTDEAYDKSYSDYLEGKNFLDNPYKDKSIEAARWVDGHVQAIIDEKNTEYAAVAETD